MSDNGEQQAPTTSVPHPLQDTALDGMDDATAGKQNWVKFDDDEAAHKIANNSNSNNNNMLDDDNVGNATRIGPSSARDALAAESAITTPTPANRSAPATLLPAPPSRKQTSVATASIPITTATTAAIARPRSPLSGAESVSGADVIVSAPAPVQVSNQIMPS